MKISNERLIYNNFFLSLLLARFIKYNSITVYNNVIRGIFKSQNNFFQANFYFYYYYFFNLQFNGITKILCIFWALLVFMRSHMPAYDLKCACKGWMRAFSHDCQGSSMWWCVLSHFQKIITSKYAEKNDKIKKSSLE